MGTTTHYGWEYPDNGSDTDTWGGIQTTMFGDMDDDLYAVSVRVTTLETRATNEVGMIADFMRTAAPTGWIELKGTIGDASSSATYANVLAQDLFNVLWAQFTDGQVPVLTSAGAGSTRGASAAADWAAHKRLTLPDQPGKFRRSYKSGTSADYGTLQSNTYTDHTHTYSLPKSGGGAAIPIVSDVQASANTAYGSTGNGSTGAGTETRPDNFAYLTCIKL